MSMHKTPLTTIEETGLIAHGFGRDIGRPSMAADIFRTGVAWAQMSIPDQITNIQKQLEHGMPFDDKLRDRFSELLAILASQAQQPTPSGKPFQTLADLLPDGFMWGDNLTPDAVLHIALAANLKQSQAQQEPVGILNHSDIALLKQWFNAVQDLNPKYLNEGDFQLLAKLQSQAQQPKEQGEPCTNSDSWNCKYCGQTKTCKAIDDDRNYSATVNPLPPAP